MIRIKFKSFTFVVKKKTLFTHIPLCLHKLHLTSNINPIHVKLILYKLRNCFVFARWCSPFINRARTNGNVIGLTWKRTPRATQYENTRRNIRVDQQNYVLFHRIQCATICCALRHGHFQRNKDIARLDLAKSRRMYSIECGCVAVACCDQSTKTKRKTTHK